VAYRVLAYLTVVLHFAFVAFVVAGGLLARRYRWLTVPHLAAAAWGVYVESRPGLICPLTPLENLFAMRAGEAGYEGGFLEHYLVPILYPEGLTPPLQWTLAAVVVVVNVAVYAWPRRRTRPGTDADGATSPSSPPAAPASPSRSR
jgi:hypothetical protein